MHRTLIRVMALTALGVIAGASEARAQTTGFSVNHFDPSERGSEWFALDTLDIRGHVRPAIGVVGEWAYRPLVVTNSDGKILRSIVRDQGVAHIGASLVLWERLRLGLDVPVQVYADGHAAQVNGIVYPPPANSTAMGDIRLALDARIFGAYGGPIVGALGVQVFFPTGDAASYAGDGNVRVAPHLLLAGDLGPFVYGAKLGANIRGIDETYGGTQVASDVSFGASAGFRVADKKLVVGPEIFGHSVVQNSSFFTSKATPVEGLFGMHYTIGDAFRAGAGVGTGLTAGYGAPVFRGILSVEWVPPPPKSEPPPDRDGDHVLDAEDACPDVPGIRTNDPKTNGCPAPADRDGDGIMDSDDACPDIAGVQTDDPKTNGCPSDRDHDGIADALDACPDVAGVKSDDPKTNGCPPDRDHDGILDSEDACPDVAGVRTSDPKTNGCPADPDRDKDGIKNEVDACPDEPGKPDPDPKRNGCPKAFVKEGQIRILDQVKFKTNSAQILPGKDSEEVLEAVVSVINAHPEIKGIRVEGHTDNKGTAALNKKLSAARAASVVKWLTGHGIDKSRLTSEGFGPDRPIEPNDTEEGRKQNRRVEFHIQGASDTTK